MKTKKTKTLSTLYFLIFIVLPALVLAASEDPQISGRYLVQDPEGGNDSGIQVYFKDDILRTLNDGSNTVSPWQGSGKATLSFSRQSGEKILLLEFRTGRDQAPTKFTIKDDKGNPVKQGIRQGAIDDDNLDPRSRSDRLGYFERHYNKLETMVSMRDGTRLLTQVFTPLDSSELHPVMIIRSPYGIEPYKEAFTHYTLPSLRFAQEKYIFVMQDIRGRSLSEGEFVYLAPYIKNKTSPNQTDESSDAYDTIDWVLKNIPGHNGKVGVWGNSYPGFSATMAAIDAHPAVKAVTIQAPMYDLFKGDDGHHLGAFYLAHYAGYSYSVWRNREKPVPYEGSRFNYGTPDGYEFFLRLKTLENIGKRMFTEPNRMWQDAMAHETYDSYWKSRSVDSHLENINPAILTVGGWFDGEDLLGTLQTYRTIEKNNPGLNNTLVMGPWVHGGWNQTFGIPEKIGPFTYEGTARYFQENMELTFFNHHLKNRQSPNIPEMLAYDTGLEQWSSFDNWPPAQSERKILYLSGHGQLVDSKPRSSEASDCDEFVSDPAKPVPYTMKLSTGYNPEYFVEDQRFASSRPDVVVYVSPPLEEQLTISGPISAELHVSTTGTDADWIVKVIDVIPENADQEDYNFKGGQIGGYQRLIRGDIIRGKFRNSFEKPEPFIPGQPTEVEFSLPDVFHTFRKGHRIMVHVQSSWFPLFDRNPQKFCNIRQAEKDDFQKAVHRVFRTADKPSAISFNVLKKRLGD